MATVLPPSNRWVVLAASSVVSYLTSAEVAMASLTMVQLIRVYPDHSPLLTCLAGINLALGPIGSVFVGPLITRFPRHLVGVLSSVVLSTALIAASFIRNPVLLFVSFGVVVGLCNGLYYVIPSITLQQYFPRKRNLVQGTMFAAHSLAFLTSPPIIHLLLDTFGWRGTLLMWAGVNLHTLPSFLLIRAPISTSEPASKIQDIARDTDANISSDIALETVPRSITTETVSDHQVAASSVQSNPNGRHTRWQLLAVFQDRPVFVIFLLGLMMAEAGNVIPFTLTPLQAVYLGFSDLKGALLISVAASISLVFRVVFGYLGDRRGSNPLILCAVGAILGGTLTALIPLPQEYSQLAATIAVLSLPSACLMATWVGALRFVVGTRHLVAGMSLGWSAFGIGLLLPFAMTGWFLDITGKPLYTFMLFGIIEAVAGITLLGVHIYMWRNKLYEPHPTDLRMKDEHQASPSHDATN